MDHGPYVKKLRCYEATDGSRSLMFSRDKSITDWHEYFWFVDLKTKNFGYTTDSDGDFNAIRDKGRNQAHPELEMKDPVYIG
jgi:hypothetical protein